MANNATIILYPGGFGGDNTTNSVNADEEIQVSSTAAGSNKPKLFRQRLAFDPSTDEHRWFQFKMPLNYSTGGTLRGSMSANAAVSTNVVWKAGIGEASGNNSDDGFLAADTTTIALSGTANQEVEFTIALTMTSIAANDPVVIFFGRDADNGSDTENTNDVHLYSLNFECELT